MDEYNVLLISGKSNSGKTTVIKHIYNQFADNHELIGENKLVKKNVEEKGDFSEVIKLKSGKTIGVISIGDKEDYIENRLNIIGKCDYYICAVHLFGATVDLFSNEWTSQKGVIHKFSFDKTIIIEKVAYPDNNYKEENENFAHLVYDIFIKYVLKVENNI